MTTESLEERLGPPNAAAEFTQEGQVGWAIGVVPEVSMTFAPVLVADVDEAGVVTSAHFQLSE